MSTCESSCSRRQISRKMNGTDGLTPRERRLWRDAKAREQDYSDITVLFIKIIAPIGILLNCLFLFVVIRVRSMRTIINVYLSNLAVADAAFLILVLSLAWAEEYTQITSGADLATFVISGTMQIASCCFVTVMAVERLSAVRQPLTQRARASKKRAAKTSAGIWGAAVVTGVLVGLTNTNYVTSLAFDQVCVTFFLLIYLGTFTVTLFSYIFIVVTLRHRDPQLRAGQTRRVYPVVRMLVINTAVFFVLTSMGIAYTIIILVVLFSTFSAEEEADIFSTALDLEICESFFGLINHSINTLVYSVTNGLYRAAFLEAIPPLAKLIGVCRRCRRPLQQTEQIELRVIPQAKTAQESPAQA